MSFIDEYIKPFIKEDLIPFSINLLVVVLILFVGFKLVKKIDQILQKTMTKRGVEASLVPFLSSIITILLKVMLVITSIGILGIPTTSLAAILAAAGLAIGMALSGTLQNFAGGVMILIFKPFKIGDFIEAQGYSGTVKEIGLFITSVTTTDNRVVMLPNGPLSNGSMVNYTKEDTRRVDWKFGMAYGDDASKAKEILMELIVNNPLVLRGEGVEPFVEMSALADSSVMFTCRAWVKTPDYWEVHFKMHEQVYNSFREKGISIPFPQMDVHIKKEN